jgi:hypothetical protein
MSDFLVDLTGRNPELVAGFNCNLLLGIMQLRESPAQAGKSLRQPVPGPRARQFQGAGMEARRARQWGTEPKRRGPEATRKEAKDTKE